jgi:hypothetical protein
MSRPSRFWILGTIVAVFALVIGAPAQDFNGSTIAPFGKECREELGALPLTWNCQAGTVIPIGDQQAGRCDSPPWLALDEAPNQCIKGARLLKLTTDKPGTDVMVICRRYQVRTDPDNDKVYEDVAVVAHNNDTGKTCFFQALNYGGMDGTNVPSPMADASKASEHEVAARAADFWKHPEDLNIGALRCSQCHDNDVWMHTPYVDQIKGKDKVPSKKADTWKQDAVDVANKYSLVEQDFFVAHNWPNPNSVLTAKVRDGNDRVKGQSCTECHRIADTETKKRWLDWYTKNPTNIKDERTDLDWTQYRIMPLESTEDNEADWQKSYDKHIEAMECCLRHPKYNGCAMMPIFGIDAGKKPIRGDAENTCIDDTGDVAFSTGMDSKVVGSRVATDNSCDAPLDKPASITFKVNHSKVGGAIDTFTKTKAGKTLGYRVPKDPNYEPSFQVYPGDRAGVSVLNTTAWDKDHHLLTFDRWSDGDSGGPANPSGCPCEDPKNPTCKFRTRGPNDWFGSNPTQPAFAGDPQSFQCVAQFKIAGNCQPPEHGSVPDKKRSLKGLVDCDCEHVDAGLLTGPYINQCRGAEKNLQQLVVDGKFHVEVGPDKKIVSGNLCDPVASGPSAWPLYGSPASPPPKAKGPKCKYVGGIVQYQCQ